MFNVMHVQTWAASGIAAVLACMMMNNIYIYIYIYILQRPCRFTLCIVDSGVAACSGVAALRFTAAWPLAAAWPLYISTAALPLGERHGRFISGMAALRIATAAAD